MKGRAFFFTDTGGTHLYFIISDPDPDSAVLVVNMTSCKGFRYEDKSCLLNPGDHPKITIPHYITYSRAKDITSFDLLQMHMNGKIEFAQPDISLQLLERIQDGARKSRGLAGKFRKFFTYF